MSCFLTHMVLLCCDDLLSVAEIQILSSALHVIIVIVFLAVCFREEILLEILKIKLQYDRCILTSLQQTSVYLLYTKPLSVVFLYLVN